MSMFDFLFPASIIAGLLFWVLREAANLRSALKSLALEIRAGFRTLNKILKR
jgi:hypothetical protein